VNKFINTTTISLSLLFTFFPINGADTQSPKMFVYSFLGVAAYSGWCLCKNFKTKIQPAQNKIIHPHPAKKEQRIPQELSVHLPEVLSDLTELYAEPTFEDVHVSTHANPTARGEVWVEDRTPLQDDNFSSLLEDDVIERFSLIFEPWDTLQSVQTKIAEHSIPVASQVLFLPNKKVGRLADLSDVLTMKTIQVYRKE
jgi:hypothetical protein